MFNFDKSDLQRFAVSALGAIALTGASVLAAAGPARAASPTPITIADWTDQVEHRLDSFSDPVTLRLDTGEMKEAVLALRFTADGDYAGAGIARSSGNAAIDAHAVRVANATRYPALPPALRGKAQTVAMRLVFGRPADALQYAEMRRTLNAPVRIADRDPSTRIAAK